jgi:predicted enzyme related to lactoylglutathione lyase
MSPTMNAIDIAVSDLEASMAFYRRLGLEFEIDAHMPEHAQSGRPNCYISCSTPRTSAVRP